MAFSRSYLRMATPVLVAMIWIDEFWNSCSKKLNLRAARPCSAHLREHSPSQLPSILKRDSVIPKPSPYLLECVKPLNRPRFACPLKLKPRSVYLSLHLNSVSVVCSPGQNWKILPAISSHAHACI